MHAWGRNPESRPGTPTAAVNREDESKEADAHTSEDIVAKRTESSTWSLTLPDHLPLPPRNHRTTPAACPQPRHTARTLAFPPTMIRQRQRHHEVIVTPGRRRIRTPPPFANGMPAACGCRAPERNALAFRDPRKMWTAFAPGGATASAPRETATDQAASWTAGLETAVPAVTAPAT